MARANVTSTSGQDAADAEAMRIGALSSAAQVVTTAAPSKRANWRAFTSRCSHIAIATEACRRKVDITTWFTNDEHLVVEYEHAALVGGVRVKIDGYCSVFHIRDARFDSKRRSYINPSNPATSILLSLVLRAYPFLARWRARGAAAS